jgi:hypothetical protein
MNTVAGSNVVQQYSCYSGVVQKYSSPQLYGFVIYLKYNIHQTFKGGDKNEKTRPNEAVHAELRWKRFPFANQREIRHF